MLRCDCIRGILFPKWIMLKAGGKIIGNPKFDFTYFKCVYCGRLKEGRLIK